MKTGIYLSLFIDEGSPPKSDLETPARFLGGISVPGSGKGCAGAELLIG
jgi:hypothetical protein